MQKALRTGIIILVSLASLVSIYAIAAIVYRSSGGVTMNALSYRSVGGVTMNRLTVIGWNTINLSILLSILWLQWRGGRSNWLRNIHLVISRSTVLYAIWCILVIIAIPLIYH